MPAARPEETTPGANGAHGAGLAARLVEAFEPANGRDDVEAQLRDAVRIARAGIAALPPGTPEAVAHVAGTLYAGWYAKTGAARAGPAIDPVHVEALRAAHAAGERFEDGWTVEQTGPRAQVIAARGPMRRVLDAIDYVNPAAPGRPPVPGAPVWPCARRDSLVAQPGWWVTWGTAWPAGPSPARLRRAYWNVSPAGAPALVSELSARLDRAGAPWSLKLPTTPAGFERADAGVLLVEAGAWAAVAPEVAAAYAAVAPFLEPAAPALAFPAAPGLALAEDPGPNESFGGQRCRLVAEAVAAAGAADEEEAFAAVLEHFRAAGIDPAQPQLGAPSAARGAPTPPAPHSPQLAPSPAVDPPPAGEVAWSQAAPAAGEDLRGAAIDIGRRLVAEAVWHEDRCTWTGDDMVPEEQSWVVVHRSLGATLYGGSAGVARFLAALARLAGDRDAAETARGALGHALRAVERLDPATRRGLYDGALGVALAALEVADALGDDGLRAAGARLAEECAGAAMPAPAVDLVSGDAGAALGFLVAAGRLDDRALLAQAVAHGERLLAGALVTPTGACWPGPAGLPPLCGLAHGASGAALALGELATATGREDFAATASDALRWERSRFDRAGVGWPDLRDPAGGTYPAHWCHGAGGIGLVRLRRHAQSGDEVALAEAGAVLEGVRGTAAAPPLDGSVCHGLSGLAEVLIAAHAVLGPAEHLADARAIGSALVARARAVGEWPCGIPGGGETPALMTGLAGIGLTLLRLHDPGVAPSPALPPGLGGY